MRIEPRAAPAALSALVGEDLAGLEGDGMGDGTGEGDASRKPTRTGDEGDEGSAGSSRDDGGTLRERDGMGMGSLDFPVLCVGSALSKPEPTLQV